ncbi:MAG: GatB/YqeY domain-containing protein [Geobacteraceae bacterium]|nr:GatB/YqeY domain-containing protein [Geobacteraceae bacterium]
MSLKDQLTDSMKTAMKARDDLRLSAVRMVRSMVKNREIDQKKELDDQEIIEVISTLVKQRRESIRMYREGNRPDLVEKEEAELEVLLGFLPAQLSSVDIEVLIDRIISETGAQGAKDMGRVMKALTPLTAGKADGKTVSDLVKQKLA